MLRVVLTSAALVLTAPVASAQDLAPALDPTATGQGILSSNIARQARGGRSDNARVRGGSEARARATCARQGEFRAKYGPDDPRVQQLDKLCRQAGY